MFEFLKGPIAPLCFVAIWLIIALPMLFLSSRNDKMGPK